jgi:parvulin-like peptidyl-prolyl isomerase
MRLGKKAVFTSLVFCIALLAAAVCFLAVKVAQTKKRLDESVIAASDYGDVTLRDIKNYLKNLENVFKKPFDFDKLTKEERETVAKEVINERVILKKAQRTNIASNREYANRLVVLGNNLLKEMFLEKLIKENVTDAKVEEKYGEMVQFLTGKKEYRVRHIVVKTRGEIDRVVSELRNSTFEKLAEKYSLDVSKNNGGDLGYVVEGQIVKEFEDAIKTQPVNRLTKPFETTYGWHIAIKEDERDAVIPSFEESKNSIRANLITEFIKKYSQDNLKESNIQFK